MINKKEYIYLCAWCNGHTNVLHEVIFGSLYRKLSIDYSIQVPLCNNCHTLVHRGIKAKKDEMTTYFLDILGLDYHNTMQAYQVGQDRQHLEESTDKRTEIIKRFMI
jgi:hypothetical protein